MKTLKQFLMILAGAALLSMTALGATRTPSSGAKNNMGAPNQPQSGTKNNMGAPNQPQSGTKNNKGALNQPQSNTTKSSKKNTPTANAAKPDKAKDEPAEVDKPAKKKRATVGAVNWILLSLGTAVVIMAVVMLLFISKLRKEQQEIKQRIIQQSAKTGGLEKMFGDKLKRAVDDAVREKNPILRDYEELRNHADAAQQALESCQSDLAASRSEYDKSNREVARLTSELGTVSGERETLQQNLDTCTKDLEAARAESESCRQAVETYELIIGKKVLNIDLEIDANDPRIRSVLLGLAKMNAMRDAGVDVRNILREFQSFDVQLNAIIRDQSDLEIVREGIRQFVEKLFNDEYRISWPKIGANIADYSRNDELDLGESASGTTIKAVKCATIRFAATDSAPFQKAKVICD